MTNTSSKQTEHSIFHVLVASLMGTTIEFFDFYIYATAAVLVFPKLFFPSGNPTTSILQSLATFALAFFARPIGAIIFGHFGDKIGRKATLVAALMTMGPSTVAIGLLPTYDSIGVFAPLLLALFRLGQGLGLGGEWGGAILLATEFAPKGKHSWYGMFPQLGAPLGFLMSSGVFIALNLFLSEKDFISFGWRIPFLASAILVWIGLYVRLKLAETPAFMEVIENNEQVSVPMGSIIKHHVKALILGTLVSVTTFLLFYLMTVFTLSWGTSHFHYPKGEFLSWQMLGVLFFGLGIPISAKLADRIGVKTMLIIATILILVFGLFFSTLFVANDPFTTIVFLIIGLFLMGLTYGPLGSALASYFPASVRYTGASLSFTLAGILGASVAPYLATWLAVNYGLMFVGYYLVIATVVTLIALVFTTQVSHSTQ
ncbi:inner membrane metabolite transport protein YhjE [Ferrovum sp. JA12]|uniref:MFS transporter n=1 Tax=Ferrovum sp. JA12 TaxID=1356299 RepID=UPI000702E59D|nr:MFS transporter [Ferrovum sp. JA12]KRH79098.1 inner membrane metabolite transport protein YhjE [Ferrovum sp. JA12]